MSETIPNNLLASVSRCILGVDPSLGGAVMFYFPGHDRLTGDDTPVVGGDVDPATLAARINAMRPDVAIVELVASRPGQGVAFVFKFGSGFGMVRGVIAACGIPMHLVSPSKWKRHFGLDSDKEKSRALALRLWPARSDLFGRKKDLGRAEAALLARYLAENREARP
jgi:crossover junction endodeoxyribonuclease RuvC